MTGRGPAYWVAVGAAVMLIAVATCVAVVITIEHERIVASQLDER